MKKVLLCFSLITLILLAAVSFKEEKHQLELQIGAQIPIFKINNSNNTFNIGINSDKYTLIIFWDSGDAESRLNCKRYTEMFHGDDLLKKSYNFAAINLDDSETIFQEIVSIDELDATRQFHLKGRIKSEIIKIYGLEKGYGSILVSPKGKIIEFNPTPESLKKKIV